MGESRTLPENASLSSEETIKAPPQLDLASVKIGRGALKPDEFDPLKHNEWENFWHQIEHHFQPVNTDHLDYLRSLPVNPRSGFNDPDLRLVHPDDIDTCKWLDVTKHDSNCKRDVKRERVIEDGKYTPHPSPPIKIKSESSVIAVRTASSTNSDPPPSSLNEPDAHIVRATLNSFPFTHRLVSALLDENVDSTPVPIVPPNRFKHTHLLEDAIWKGYGTDSTDSEIRARQAVIEDRVKNELIQVGLLDKNVDDELQTAVRQEQWALRDQKTASQNRICAIHAKVAGHEMHKQAVKREEKRHDDKVEMVYLERMIQKLKKNKKSRSKFHKLFQKMYGHYKDKGNTAGGNSKKGMESNTNSRAVQSDEKSRSSIKKKKKPVKKSNHDLPAKSFPASGGASRSSMP